jgi:tetratricopeptide (TPR) repeat protein/MinD-like ATPase involved in chromosome partitioning or flagellar assembly
MFTVTFYSFKGGVGRTLSLMNTAYRLSKRGRTVFILDFDLEAPGVDVFFPSTQPSAGLLDCIAHYSETGTVPPIQDFVSEMTWDNTGKVYYIPAGRRDQNYQSLLAKLNWKDFYGRHEGFFFVENLKAAIQVLYKPDYLLVDSRTGLTDISGICTLQLPDLVVLLFGLNDQNLIGTSQIYRSITHNKLDRSIQTLLVASPVPDVPEFVSIKGERLQRAKELLGTEPDMVLPFNAFVAFKETIIPSEMGEFLNQAYESLCDRIVSCNKADVSTLLREARKSAEAGDAEQAEAVYRQILEANPRDNIAWTEFGSFLRASGKYSDALNAYREAERNSAPPSIYGDIAVTLLYARQSEEARKYLSQYLSFDFNPKAAFRIARAFAFRDQAEAAIEAFERITVRDPDLAASASGEIGNLYLRLNVPERALSHFELSMERAPNSFISAFNVAVTLEKIGRRSDSVEWFTRAATLFERTKFRGRLPGEIAGSLQAIGRAYASTGDPKRAINLLNESMAIAKTVPTTIFSFVQYKNVPAVDFMRENETLMANFLGHSPAIPKDQEA